MRKRNTFLDRIMEAIVGLFVIAIFVTSILPALSEATGQSVDIFYIIFIMLAIAIILSIINR